MAKIIVPGEFDKKERLMKALSNEKAVEGQWTMAKLAIDAWKHKYPREWLLFRRGIIENQTTYNEAREGDLKKASWRNTAAFPVAYYVDEFGLEQEDSMLPVLEKIIPGLTKNKSKNFREFLRRFPEFQPSEKTNA